MLFNGGGFAVGAHNIRVAGIKRDVWLYSLHVMPVVDVNRVTKFIERRQPVK